MALVIKHWRDSSNNFLTTQAYDDDGDTPDPPAGGIEVATAPERSHFLWLPGSSRWQTQDEVAYTEEQEHLARADAVSIHEQLYALRDAVRALLAEVPAATSTEFDDMEAAITAAEGDFPTP